MSKRLIYAEDAIDALMEILDRPNHAEFLYTDEICKALEELPSAQPEIIRCKDCKHMQEDKIFHQCWCNGREVKYDDFCSYAERKEDETNSRNKTC